jgi:hypothetical protein
MSSDGLAAAVALPSTTLASFRRKSLFRNARSIDLFVVVQLLLRGGHHIVVVVVVDDAVVAVVVVVVVVVVGCDLLLLTAPLLHLLCRAQRL